MNETNDTQLNSLHGAGTAWTAASRFAIYYAPSRMSPWWSAGCRWLGRDPESGETLAAPVVPALAARPRDVSDLTRSPRRYGWHGTLVAPAHCAEQITPDDVLRRALAWAARQRSFDLPIEVVTLHRFVALRPATAEAAAAMRGLAADALHEFAPLRAMPGEEDRRRRLAADLSARQRELLDRWGYPYVLDEFRFHMTLSDSLEEADDRQALTEWWRTQIPTLGPLRIDGAALFVEPMPGKPFTLVARLPFGDTR
ncbi:DUF1045 domain-containing protein [Burkholderia sp. WSM2230]|uniref:DUF1045 domain-containing protein n=1 Tax=Burkholderia sp. WSM2230 TaxID=944435 RepID=UPI000407FC4A|nr:DUF1045 domain-containing protein [Burkholderia sp. WSM2230]